MLTYVRILFQTAADWNVYTKDECQTQPCLNGGSCVSSADGNYCSCTSGFEGKSCELSAINDCPAINPCLNGGTCVDGQGSYTCNCTATFQGPICECFSNFSMKGSHCLRILTPYSTTTGQPVTVDISTAENACAGYGANVGLANIKDAVALAEAKLLELRSDLVYVSAQYSQSAKVWRWQDNSIVDFNWGTGEPTTGRNCVAYKPSQNYTFFTESCNTVGDFVCQVYLP
ncbi:hypothetical protein DPMN_126980 [Dreissena polymorpha]|uniref:C-type lectin n=1 Tax=Dreissena polymorpha TaxID=45954 RepID=A0A9D4H4C0_DREPO|nr:hypothetical protein DPMN_126980 [Dreissena polymorpha]